MPNITDYNQQVADAADELTAQITNGAVAPLAAGVVATVNAPKAGLYEVWVVAGYGGTADVVDNMDLAVGGTLVVVLPVVAAANADRIPVTVLVRCTNGQAVAVRAIAAGAVGSVYRATIVLKRVLD